MSRDMDATVQRDTLATVRVRREKFVLMFLAIGAKGPTQIGDRMGVDRKTVSRALDDDIVGEVFMAKAVVALRRHSDLLQELGLTPSLDALFEVPEVDAMAEVAA